MKAIILAGGLGTRLAEETTLRPKPMVEIGGRPILWHIMKNFHAQGVKEFVICLGYRGFMIKEYFQNYALHQCDVTFDMVKNTMQIHRADQEDWRVTLVDTGEKAMTGARMRKVLPFVKDDDAFCMTYGDGVADIDVKALIEFHKSHGRLATLTAVAPPGRFGALIFDDATPGRIKDFIEKPEGDGGLINGGFFVLSPKVGEYLGKGDEVIWERAPMAKLAADKQLMAYRHKGFWKPMDTIRDRNELEQLWESGAPPWKVW